jgi:hypothetical protein
VAVCFVWASRPAAIRGADAFVDGAVNALAQLTDPRRLEALPEPAFRAQLGPALGWLHVARRRDVAPEAVLGRAFALNGLDAARARRTQDALLRNLARADAWELFAHDDSARALAGGLPAPIRAGIHRGHLAETAVVPASDNEPAARHEFAWLTLRADDEPALLPTPTPGPTRRHARQPGDLLARSRVTPTPGARAAAHLAATAPLTAAVNASPAIAYDDALPVAYTTLGQDRGTINVRVEARAGERVDLAAYGGPPLAFLLRGIDVRGVQFSLLDGSVLAAHAPVQFAGLDGTGAGCVYDRAGVVRISACGGTSAPGSATRTMLFEFPADEASR